MIGSGIEVEFTNFGMNINNPLMKSKYKHT